MSDKSFDKCNDKSLGTSIVKNVAEYRERYPNYRIIDCPDYFFDCYEYYCPENCPNNYPGGCDEPKKIVETRGFQVPLPCSNVEKRVYMRGSLGNLTEEESKFLIFDYDKFLIFFRRTTDIPLDTPEENIKHSRLLDMFDYVCDNNMSNLPIPKRTQINITQKMIRVSVAIRELRDTMCTYYYCMKYFEGLPIELPSSLATLSTTPGNSSTPPTVSGATQGAKGKTANEKLQDFILENPECQAWTSKKLAVQIGETAETVRQTDTWKALSKKRKYLKEQKLSYNKTC